MFERLYILVGYPGQPTVWFLWVFPSNSTMQL